jgi:hypothetical protein
MLDTPMSDLYNTLGIARSATREVCIRRAIAALRATDVAMLLFDNEEFVLFS